jgi:hypothetical protein
MGGCKGFGGIYKSTWHHNSEDQHEQLHRRENLKSLTEATFFISDIQGNHISRSQRQTKLIEQNNLRITFHDQQL